jgi:heme exporter protein B
MLNLDIGLTPMLVATMLAGTPAISFLGSIGAALTLKSRRGGLLLALLVLPLYIPTLIFGISAIGFASLGQDGASASLLILSAISLASIAAGPFASAAALRLQMS